MKQIVSEKKRIRGVFGLVKTIKTYFFKQVPKTKQHFDKIKKLFSRNEKKYIRKKERERGREGERDRGTEGEKEGERKREIGKNILLFLD